MVNPAFSKVQPGISTELVMENIESSTESNLNIDSIFSSNLDKEKSNKKKKKKSNNWSKNKKENKKLNLNFNRRRFEPSSNSIWSNYKRHLQGYC